MIIGSIIRSLWHFQIRNDLSVRDVTSRVPQLLIVMVIISDEEDVCPANGLSRSTCGDIFWKNNLWYFTAGSASSISDEIFARDIV